MFIVRTVFWLSLVVLILPTDARQQQQLTSKLVSTVHHMSSFCDRNASACETGARYWDLFTQKADYGFQLAVSVISNQFGGNTAPMNNGDGKGASAGTLQPQDLAPAWRGNRS